jgi:hypothetical protein
VNVQALREGRIAVPQDGTGATSRGVANTTGVVVVTAPLTGLATFAQSIAALIGQSAVPQAVVMNRLDIGTMLSLTEFSGRDQQQRAALEGRARQGRRRHVLAEPAPRSTRSVCSRRATRSAPRYVQHCG